KPRSYNPVPSKIVRDSSTPLGMTKRPVKKTVGSAPLPSRALTLCHVERICQSGSDRDISYHFCRPIVRDGKPGLADYRRLRCGLDSAQNDKDAQAVGGATGPASPAISKNDFLSIRSKMPFSLMKRFDISVLMTDELRAFLQGAHPDPFRILGPHRLRDDVLVRVFRPDAREVSIKLDNNGSIVPAEKIQGDGLFQATLEK